MADHPVPHHPNPIYTKRRCFAKRFIFFYSPDCRVWTAVDFYDPSRSVPTAAVLAFFGSQHKKLAKRFARIESLTKLMAEYVREEEA